MKRATANIAACKDTKEETDAAEEPLAAPDLQNQQQQQRPQKVDLAAQQEGEQQQQQQQQENHHNNKGQQQHASKQQQQQQQQVEAVPDEEGGLPQVVEWKVGESAHPADACSASSRSSSTQQQQQQEQQHQQEQQQEQQQQQQHVMVLEDDPPAPQSKRMRCNSGNSSPISTGAGAEVVVEDEDSEVLEVGSDTEAGAVSFCDVTVAYVWVRAEEAAVTHALEVVKHAEETARNFMHQEQATTAANTRETAAIEHDSSN